MSTSNECDSETDDDVHKGVVKDAETIMKMCVGGWNMPTKERDGRDVAEWVRMGMREAFPGRNGTTRKA